MKRTALLGAAILLGASLVPTFAGDKEDVAAAARKLADSGYSWKITTEFAGGNQFGGGATHGKIAKDGTAVVKTTRGENTTTTVFKGDKAAMETQDGWQSREEIENSSDNRARFMARMLTGFEPPAAQVTELLKHVTDMTSADGMITAKLTEEGAKNLMRFGGRGGQGPEISGAGGTIKFWVKDGALAKYEYSLKGTMSWNGNDRDMDRTTTVEVTDVGSTEVEVPEGAKSKLS